jgi:hypothetical protein
MSKRKFWPLDFDLEGEIYENIVWDLPGYSRIRVRRLVRQPASPESPRTKPA